MSLHEELTAGSSACKVCTFLANLPESESAAEWVTELALPATIVSHTAVMRALRKRGVEVTESSIKRHRSNHVSPA